MPFFQSDSAFTISGGSFNNIIGNYITVNGNSNNTRGNSNNATGNSNNISGSTAVNHDIVFPPSDSQIPSDGNQSNADAPKFSTIIGEVGPRVSHTLDKIARPTKTDDIDQLPKTDDHPVDQLPKTDDQLPTEAASLPDSEEKGWVRCVHPEGWIYFFKKHGDEPEDIQLHEICGDLKGEIITNPSLISKATNATSYEREQLSGVEGEGSPVALGYGGLYVQTYVDDQRWYASINKGLLFYQQLTDEQGQDYLV